MFWLLRVGFNLFERGIVTETCSSDNSLHQRAFEDLSSSALPMRRSRIFPGANFHIHTLYVHICDKLEPSTQSFPLQWLKAIGWRFWPLWHSGESHRWSGQVRRKVLALAWIHGWILREVIKKTVFFGQ